MWLLILAIAATAAAAAMVVVIISGVVMIMFASINRLFVGLWCDVSRITVQ